MNYPKIIIYNYNKLFDILNELSDELNLEFLHINKDKIDKIEKIKNENVSILSKQKLKDNKNYILLENFPYDIKKLLQLININLLSKNFNKKSKIRIGNYNLDVNARNIVNNKIKLKLTEKEIDIILFLKKHQKSISIKEMQSQVWQYNKDLETHTVETHVHRLKKKFKSVFKDDDFIISFNGGYKIN